MIMLNICPQIRFKNVFPCFFPEYGTCENDKNVVGDLV